MSKLSASLTLILVLGGAGLLAFLNLATPPDFALHVPVYVISLVGKYLCYAMLALAVDLVWGFAGILTLGHAAFFALGGYAMGMYLMREIGTRGVYGNPLLPDFMVFLGWHELPWYWHGMDNFALAALMVMLVPGLLALVFGWLAFRSRVTGVYLSIITQALTYALLLAFFRNDMGFGGNNGMTDFKDLLGVPLQAETTRVGLLLLTALFLCAQFLIARYVVTSRFGKILIAVRYRSAHALPGLPAGIVQAVRLRAVGRDGGHRRGALCAAGRHHQPERVRARQLDRGGDLGRRRRPRHAGRRHPRCRARQPRQDLLHQRAAGALAIRAGCSLHLRHPAAAEGRDGPVHPPRKAPRHAGDNRGRRLGREGGHGMSETIGRQTDTLLYVDGVNVSFDGFRALNDLSLVLEPGEMRAVIGPNGAGKTTMMDVITGKTRPDTGKVVFGRDTDLTRLDEPAIAALGIGRKFQKPTVFEVHTVWDNLLLALAGDRRPRFTLWARQTDEEKDRIEAILKTTRLTDMRHRIAGGLSHGQKQWLEIGMLLAQEPQLLLVDEPVAGMTDAETEQTAELLRDINQTRSVVVVEHDMAFVRALGVKVTVLHEGSVLSEGSIDYVSEDPKVVEVYLGR